MNSFLQQLFMNDHFKRSLLGTTIGTDEDDMYDLLQKLKQLFLQLIFSEEMSLSALPFSKTIKGSNNKPMISVYNQMDIDEFSNILFDRVEQQLSILGQDNFIRNIFGGNYAQHIISYECPHSSERDQ